MGRASGNARLDSRRNPQKANLGFSFAKFGAVMNGIARGRSLYGESDGGKPAVDSWLDRWLISAS
jgi:hypothetical protein